MEPSFPVVSRLAAVSILSGLLAGWAQAQPEPPRVAPPPAEGAEATPTAAVTATAASTAAPEDDTDVDSGRRRHRKRHGRGDVRFGQGVTVAAGEEHTTDIVVFGGGVDIAGKQRGDVVVFGGGLNLSGEVSGNVVVFGGGAALSPTARVDGDLVLLGGSLDKDPAAVINGESVSLPGGNFGAGFIPAMFMGLGSIGLGLSIFAWVKTAALALLLGLVVAAVLPVQVEAAAGVLRERWPHCMGVGFAAFVAAIPLTLLLCLTCVGAIIPYLVYQVAKYFGLAVLFLVVGQAVGRAAGRELGSIAALLVGFLALSIIGLLAPPAWWVYGWIGVGVALLTRFGTMRPWWNRDRHAVTTT
jgi:hypothetical protein